MNKVLQIGRIVVGLGWATTGLWEKTTAEEKRIFLISLHILRQGDDSALAFLLGPISVMIGVARADGDEHARGKE